MKYVSKKDVETCYALHNIVFYSYTCDTMLWNYPTEIYNPVFFRIVNNDIFIKLGYEIHRFK